MLEPFMSNSRLMVLLLVIPLLVSSAQMNYKAADGVPIKDNARINLRDTYTGALIWYYHNPGDYNQDGVVNASDITPLGAHFRETPTYTTFYEYEIMSLIDGDGNSIINAADITPIGANFGNDLLGGFNIYEAASLDDYPLSNAGESRSGAQLLGHIDLAETLTDIYTANKKRLEFTFQVKELSKVNYYWIRPVDKAGNEGIPSNTIVQLGCKVPRNYRSMAKAWWDGETNSLVWLYYNAGDYDQNGVVQVADLTPIAQHMNQQSPHYPSPWPETSIESVIDGNEDGVINPNDIDVIGLYFDRRVEA